MIDWPTRSDAAKLSDEQLLEKLQGFGLEVDRAELARVCEGALSAEEVARPLLDRCGAGDREGRPHEDWMWLCLLEPGFRASPRGSIIRGWSPTEIRPQLAASAVGRRPSVPDRRIDAAAEFERAIAAAEPDGPAPDVHPRVPQAVIEALRSELDVLRGQLDNR